MRRSLLMVCLWPLVLACGEPGSAKLLSGETRSTEATQSIAVSPAVAGNQQNAVADAAPAPPLPDIGDLTADTVLAPVSSGTPIAPSMLIRSGQASVEVKSIDTAMVQVRQLAQRLGGYIANSSVQGGQHTIRSATLDVKLPAAQFDNAVAGLHPFGTVESVNITSEDVGEEFVDVTARMTNARRLEERLVSLLASRAGKLEDVLAVERELARIREEIERYEGRIRYLKTRAAVSTLTVTVHESAPILNTFSGNPIVEAFKQAWRNFVEFVATFIALLGVLIPLAVLFVIAWIVFRRIRRKAPK